MGGTIQSPSLGSFFRKAMWTVRSTGVVMRQGVRSAQAERTERKARIQRKDEEELLFHQEIESHMKNQRFDSWSIFAKLNFMMVGCGQVTMQMFTYIMCSNAWKRRGTGSVTLSRVTRNKFLY